MKIVTFERFGPPAEVLRCVERDDPRPGRGEVAVRMRRMPINPADLLLVEGRYGLRLPALPATPGAEGAGTVAALGEGVAGFALGDVVVPLVNGLWRSRVVCRADQLLRIPAGIDLDQAAMIKANPATAAALLDEAEAAAPGAALIQNAANSAVGRLLACLARDRGMPVVNVVRRADAADAIRREDGSAIVLVHDGIDPEALAASAAAALPDRPIGFAVDAIGGAATDALAACLAPGGTVVNYGLLGGEPCRLDPRHLVFRGIVLRGFWLPTWFRTASRERAAALYADLIERLGEGTLATPVAASYPLERVTEAVAHAALGARGGKVMLTAD